tara:strand:- start:1418 stop:2122 length:705 start_codon:yes stop_codon:yes gene_type:complete
MAKPKRGTKKHLVMCEALLPDATQRDLLRQMIQPLVYLRCAVSVTDFEGNRFLYVNPAWEMLYGHKARSVMGKPVGKVLNLENISQRVVARIEADSRNGGWEGHLVNQNKKGEVFTINLRTACLYGPEDKPLGLLGVSFRLDDPAINGETNLQKPKGLPGNWKELMGIITPRELEVFELFGRGQSTTQVAKSLDMSKFTVQSHRNHLKKKLKVKTNPGLNHLAFLWVNQGSRRK